jgi:hypothetical protein
VRKAAYDDSNDEEDQAGEAVQQPAPLINVLNETFPDPFAAWNVAFSCQIDTHSDAQISPLMNIGPLVGGNEGQQV